MNVYPQHLSLPKLPIVSEFGISNQIGLAIKEHFTHQVESPLMLDLQTFPADELPNIISSSISACMTVLNVCSTHNGWFQLNTLVEADPERTHGIGENPLHIDYISHGNPPEIIVFLCVNSDPHGGGYTQLASFQHAVSSLSSGDRDALSLDTFKYWADESAQNVGEVLQTFSILPSRTQHFKDGFVRFSAKMLPHLHVESPVLDQLGLQNLTAIRSAMLNLFKNLCQYRYLIPLKPKHALIFDQRWFAHGRLAMGYGQTLLSTHERRELLQLYAKV